MKKKILIILLFSVMFTACSDSEKGNKEPVVALDVTEQNLTRAMEITDEAISCYFTGAGMKMSRYYNPHTNTASAETGSIWMYTSSIEAVNAILHGLKAMKESGKTELYNQHFNRYVELLRNLYDNADYYKGTFTLTSYTQTKEWTVYGVNRGNDKGTAEVEEIMNVYDDQQWLVREYLEAYKLTNDQTYLAAAEYLTEYVLDGWDTVLDSNGEEYGGIPWGPGYVTKHSCSNGPMISPLVWLHELYKGKDDEIMHRYIDTDKSRKTVSMKKSDYYLNFAEKVYKWQKTHLLRSDGVYDDMMGGCDPDCDVAYEIINGTKYRKHTNLLNRAGPAITYNSGTMLSGAADLYRATGDVQYQEDAKKLTDASFTYFAKLGSTIANYYTYDISGFRNWFNGVLMRGYVDAYSIYKNTATCIDSFQKNLDYAYDNFVYNGFLPVNLLVGWNRESGKNNVEAMFEFAFAAEYAVLARYEIEKDN